jgi:preprotein translocase subunit YajC
MMIFPWFDWLLRVVAGCFILLLFIIAIMYVVMGRRPDRSDKKQKDEDRR